MAIVVGVGIVVFVGVVTGVVVVVVAVAVAIKLVLKMGRFHFFQLRYNFLEASFLLKTVSTECFSKIIFIKVSQADSLSCIIFFTPLLPCVIVASRNQTQDLFVMKRPPAQPLDAHKLQKHQFYFASWTRSLSYFLRNLLYAF